MEARDLKAADRPQKFYRYTVEGSGIFPFDMLRYDGAWPARSEDASRLVTSKGHAEGSRSIEVCSHYSPTVDRWKSFGWLVVE